MFERQEENRRTYFNDLHAKRGRVGENGEVDRRIWKHTDSDKWSMFQYKSVYLKKKTRMQGIATLSEDN